MRINSILLSVAVLAAVGARTTAMAEAIRCLTGNARPAARVAGTYTILKAGLSIPGFPASDTPEETKRSFASGRLTDGNTDTLFEWPDREFGKLGRDIEVDLGDDYLLTRVEVESKGNRLHNSRLYLKPDNGLRFVPVRHFDKQDYLYVKNDWRGRTFLIRFDKLGLVARHIRVNVKGSHDPRFAELRIWGREAGADDTRQIPPLLPYGLGKLTKPAEVEQVPPPAPVIATPSGDGPRFALRGVRLIPPNVNDKDFHKRLVLALAELKFNRIIHEGLDWAVNFESWKTSYSKAISVEELKDVIKSNESLGFKTTPAWGVAPCQWVLHERDPSRVEARPGEAYMEGGRIKFKRYEGEVLYRLGRVNACPLHPENFETFMAVTDELCSIYRDEYFFGGVDEPLQWYNGSRWACCERCQGREPVQLMADWVNKCSDHIRNKHRRIHMYQTTIILKEHQGEAPGYPGGPEIQMYRIIDQMPKDRTALVNWSYDVWRRAHNAPDSSGLNRYLATKGYQQIIQNVGYSDASFRVCEFTRWAGAQGADFMGAMVANYGGQSLDDMARRFKFLDYVVAAQELWWNVSKTGTRETASQIVNGLEKTREIMEATRIPSRSAGPKDFFTVELKDFVNRSTRDEKPFDGRGWVDLGPGLDLRALPLGKREFCGIPFVLVGPTGRQGLSCVMVEASSLVDRSLPNEIEGIPVRRRAESLIFLHALTERMEPNTEDPAFLYRVSFADGAVVDFPARYRIEVMEWLDQSAAGPADFHIGWFLYGARPAWLGVTASGKRCIVYASEWINPYPDKEIAKIDLVLPSSSTAKGAALFAITGVAALQRTSWRIR